MSTFIGHALAGTAIAAGMLRQTRAPAFSGPWVWIAGAVLAVAPDFDAVAFPLLGPEWLPTGHRGLSHSFGAAAGAGAAAVLASMIVCRRAGDLVRIGLAAFSCVYSHALMDAASGSGRPLALLWPLSDHVWRSPFAFLPAAVYSRAVPDLAELFGTPHNLATVGLEALLFGVPAFSAVRGAWRFRRAAAGLSAPEPLETFDMSMPSR